MSRGQIPLIVLRGTPAERGHQHGATLRALILASIDQLRKTVPDGQWQRGRVRSALCLEELRGRAPGLAAELQGIADATNLTIQDVLLLSAFEFLGDRSRGCTSAALAQPGGAIVAQNWDAPADVTQNLVALIHEDSDKLLFTIASAGTLGWVGMNAHGLAIVNNDLLLDESEDGMPSLIVRRLMLDQTDADGALSVLRANKHLSGRCFTIGDAKGKVHVAEIGPSAGVTDRAVRCAVHTNHPIFSKPAMWEDIEAVARTYPSSRSRLRAARSYALRSIDDVSAVLRDRSNAPDAISKSHSQREPTATAFSVIFDCRRREALVALGRPDTSTYQTIAVSHLAAA